MGLDMYLEKCNRKAWGYKDFDIEDIKQNKPKLYEELKPYIHQRGSELFRWESLFEEVGYWRKASAIHKWFVDNVQNGEDDCCYHEVTKEQLENLLRICKTVKSLSELKNGWVKNGERFENGMWCPMFEEGQTIVNSEVAAKLLPTQSGFFFGDTDYDQWYMQDIERTIEILTKVLDTTYFDVDMVVYCSSW
jgi:hypothetical protein